MLRSETFDQLVAARLLDFFAAESPWQRRLWDIGSCLALAEITEATQAVSDGALSDKALSWLVASAAECVGRDPGVGTADERSTLIAALKPRLRAGGFDSRIIRDSAEVAASGYLRRWAEALDDDSFEVRPERAARSIGGHMLGIGFSPEYLHRWWTYRIAYEQGTRSLSDLVREADFRCADPPTLHRVTVPLRRATARVKEIPGWIDPATASDLLTPLNKGPIASLAGAISLEVTAHDYGQAAGIASDRVDGYIARITLGGGNEGLDPLPYAWVHGDGRDRKLRLRRRRGLEVPVLLRRSEPITHPVGVRIDSSLELLSAVDSGPPASAVSGGWAAIETLLVAPGDQGKVHAADRMASLVACSFPRAELTQLAHQVMETGTVDDPELPAILSRAKTNTWAAGKLAERLATGPIGVDDVSDSAAIQRSQALVVRPRASLLDIERHLQRSFRRLYRVRNLVLHGAVTSSPTLTAALGSTAPLIGAGMDRVVRGVLLQDVDPVGLAVRARRAIDNADNLGPRALADLLQVAD